MLRRRRLGRALERFPRRHTGPLRVGLVEQDQTEVAQRVDPRELVAARRREAHCFEERCLGFLELAPVVESDAEDAVGDRQPQRARRGGNRERLPRDLFGVRELAELEAQNCMEDDALRHGGGVDQPPLGLPRTTAVHEDPRTGQAEIGRGAHERLGQVV